jgi:hypothetical protein
MIMVAGGSYISVSGFGGSRVHTKHSVLDKAVLEYLSRAPEPSEQHPTRLGESLRVLERASTDKSYTLHYKHASIPHPYSNHRCRRRPAAGASIGFRLRSRAGDESANRSRRLSVYTQHAICRQAVHDTLFHPFNCSTHQAKARLGTCQTDIERLLSRFKHDS